MTETSPLPNRLNIYQEILGRIDALIEGETDAIAIMATVASELHHHFDHFDWTGFYRVVSPGLLKIGPYQGGHGCLVIPFERGVCGRSAREGRTIVVPDVAAEPDHIACSHSTRSEIVVPVHDSSGGLRAVLDVDSNTADAFTTGDAGFLEQVCKRFAKPGIAW
jgi:L-methionine (R)-S-oxide reductase